MGLLGSEARYPVEWKQISGARVIAETAIQGREVEPSQGSHFFHNITSLGIGYLTLGRTSRDGPGGPSFVDLDWLDAQTAVRETATVRHVRFDQPLVVVLDGRRGRPPCSSPSMPGSW